MTIEESKPASQENSPSHAPLEGSKQCPFCAPDRWLAAGASFTSNELSLLSHFVGVWEHHPGWSTPRRFRLPG
jgi:hypothetical protein